MTCRPRPFRKRAGGSDGLLGGRGGSGRVARFRPRPAMPANPESLRRPASGAEGEGAPRFHRPRRWGSRSEERRPEGGAGGWRPPAPRAVRFRTRTRTPVWVRAGTPFRMQTRTPIRFSLWTRIRAARPTRNAPAVRTLQPVSIRRIRPRSGGSSASAAATPRSAGRSRYAWRVRVPPPQLSGAPGARTHAALPCPRHAPRLRPLPSRAAFRESIR